MTVAIITDQHLDGRKGSINFWNYFKKFYDNVFFPTLEKKKIRTLIDLGDTFDQRKGIDYNVWNRIRTHYFQRLECMGIEVHMIVGNHTAYYKNTNEINTPGLLLREFSNIAVYARPQEIIIEDTKILMIPWINSQNREETLNKIESTDAPLCMGHLELGGFEMVPGMMGTGMSPTLFSKFKKVLSGHYHHKSSKGNVTYIGNPYEMFWNDYNDTRGFHIFDTETLEHTPIDNPYTMFKSIDYDDTPYQTFDSRDFEDKIVKVIVRKKSSMKDFEKFIDKLYSSNIAELKVVENFQIKNEEFEAFESEDTISILNRYIEEAEIELDKSVVQKMMQEVYQEACEMT